MVLTRMLHHGRKLRLSYRTTDEAAYTPIAVAKSCVLSFDRDMIETASPVDGAPRSYIPGAYGWTIRTETLYCNYGSFFQLLAICKEGTPLQVQLEALFPGTWQQVISGSVNTTRVNTHTYTGTAYLEAVELTGTVGNLSRVTATLRGTGGLTQGTSLLLQQDAQSPTLLD